MKVLLYFILCGFQALYIIGVYEWIFLYKASKVVPNDITLKLPAARSVEDNPVHKTKILTVKENKMKGCEIRISITKEI